MNIFQSGRHNLFHSQFVDSIRICTDYKVDFYFPTSSRILVFGCTAPQTHLFQLNLHNKLEQRNLIRTDVMTQVLRLIFLCVVVTSHNQLFGSLHLWADFAYACEFSSPFSERICRTQVSRVSASGPTHLQQAYEHSHMFRRNLLSQRDYQ